MSSDRYSEEANAQSCLIQSLKLLLLPAVHRFLINITRQGDPGSASVQRGNLCQHNFIFNQVQLSRMRTGSQSDLTTERLVILLV